MSEIDELRKKRMQQLIEQQKQSQLAQAQLQQLRQQEEIEAQIKLIINKILTPEARSRLGNIRTVRPEFARQIELFLIQLYQTGRLPKQLSDEELKKILVEISNRKKEIRIKRG